MPYSMQGLRTILFVGAAFSLGITLVAAWTHFVESSRPDPPILVDHEIGRRSEAGALWLTMHFRVRSAAKCVRQGVQLIYRDIPGQPRDYYNLGSSLNGGNLKGAVNDYRVWFALPLGLPSGQWNFIFRSVYSCPPLGLVMWDTTTEPLPITVPEKR